MVSGISGGPIDNFREGWAILPFVGGHCKPHYWQRIELSNLYVSKCGVKGALATREMLVARGMPHATSVKPFEPGVFMVDRCKNCQRKHQKHSGEMRTAGKTTVRNDALAHIAKAVKPAQPAGPMGSDLRATGGSARRRVPPSSPPSGNEK